MNMGYEEEELKPYVEPQPDLNDQKRIGKTGTVQQQRFIILDRKLNFFPSFLSISFQFRLLLPFPVLIPPLSSRIFLFFS